MTKFAIGDRIIVNKNNYNGIIKSVNDDTADYLVEICSWNFDHVISEFSYTKQELREWDNPRYIVRGDTAFRIYDASSKEQIDLHIGTWSIWDNENENYLAHITSDGSRQISDMMTKSLNDGTYWPA